jgi:2'-5' RNA ligase
MRLFLAIALPPEDRSRLAQLQQELAAARADVKWVETENLHLTLRFLGEVPAAKMQLIGDVVQPVVAALAAPQLQLGGLGTFPSKGSPRVVWCGFERGDEELRRLVEHLSDALEGIGFALEERRYTAHVTIGRVRGRHNSAALRRACETTGADAFEAHVVSEVVLIESRLDRSGPHYTVRKRFAFAPSR